MLCHWGERNAGREDKARGCDRRFAQVWRAGGSEALENVPGAPRQERLGKRESTVAPPPCSERCTRTSLRNSSASCSWEALSLSAHGLARFPFPRILHQPGQMYLLYLSPVMIQLTEILELGTRISRNASCHCLSTDNVQHSCPPFTNPPPSCALELPAFCCSIVALNERLVCSWRCTPLQCISWKTLKKTLQWVCGMFSSIEQKRVFTFQVGIRHLKERKEGWEEVFQFQPECRGVCSSFTALTERLEGLFWGSPSARWPLSCASQTPRLPSFGISLLHELPCWHAPWSSGIHGSL